MKAILFGLLLVGLVAFAMSADPEVSSVFKR